MTETQNTQGQGFSNQMFTDWNTIRFRADPQSIIEEFEMYLRGYSEVNTIGADGALLNQKVIKGEALVNEYGHQNIMQTIRMIFNHQNVQGNFITEKEYYMYLKRLREDFTGEIVANLHVYGFKNVSMAESLIDKFMLFAEPFFSRLIRNKERESYGATMKMVENTQVGQKRDWTLGWLGGKRGG